MEKITAECRWANVYKPNTTFNDSGIYQIDLIIDKEEDKKRLKKLGLSLIEKDDGTLIFRPKRNAKGKRGPNPPPKVYDNIGQETTLEIGNGSVVEVAFNVFDFKKIKGRGADLCGVKIVKLVAYTKDVKDVFDFDEEPNKISEDNPFD